MLIRVTSKIQYGNMEIMDGISALTSNSAFLGYVNLKESFADLYDSNLLDLTLGVKLWENVCSKSQR